MTEKVPNLRAASAEFADYIADKTRYVSITDQQGPLRPGESQLRAPRRQYIKTKMQWDARKACWMNKDGRPLITRDLIWGTIIAEMRRLDSFGQGKVWSTVKGKFDGIQEDDARAVSKMWSKHNLYLLDPQDDSEWDVNAEAHTNPINPVSASSTDGAGLGCTGNKQLEGPPSPNTIHPLDSRSLSPNRQQLLESSKLEHDSQQTNDSTSAGALPDDPLPDNDFQVSDDHSNLGLEQKRVNQNNIRRAALEDTARPSQPSFQYLQSVSIPMHNPVIDKVARKRSRRANSTERLQRYTEKLMDNYARRPSRQAKMDVEGLRGVGAGIYGSNRSFAQETAERVSRTNELADFVENTQPKQTKRGQGMRSRHKSRPPSPVEDEDDGNDDADDDDNDNDDEDEDDEDDDDDEGDYERKRKRDELYDKHLRLAIATGLVSGNQATYGPMLA